MSDRYPLARWMPAGPRAFRKGALDRKVTKLVLHVTDGHGVAAGTAEMFASPMSRTSAHLVVGQAGEIVQCVSLDDIAYHAHTANPYTVGIEHCARSPRELGPTDPGLPLSELQIAASVQLVEWLCDRYGLPLDRDHVQGHAEADPATDHTDCPTGVAGGWPWERWCSAAAVCA
ncbi:MAG: N-acetylmuramoyl-L-alanine amidase [Chloroflexota bacterium]|nr:N-acetylmuramoyl-L-alanine amidase [Chloroflexota bacterium]